MKKLFGILTAVAFATSVFAGEYPDITIKDLKSAIHGKKVALIDANGTESWEKGHIPGAIDFETSRDSLAKLLPKDKSTLIVAYCGGPSCMAYQSAAKVAKQLGYKNVKHLSAGISGWTKAGEKTETAANKEKADSATPAGKSAS
jgi:rhodanese-related sulfurtransferase